MKKLYIFFLFIISLNTLQAQINTALPVGSIPGSADVSLTGSATYTIPIEVPPGTQGLQPNLAITYNSGGGDNGIMGRSWNLSGISCITREGQNLYFDNLQTPVLMTYYDGLSWDGQRLLLKADGTYGTADESFAKITPKRSDGKVIWFEIQTKDGKTLEYGRNSYSRVETAPGTEEIVYKYYLTKITDANGNTITYQYNANGVKDRMIEQIEYTKNASQSGQAGGEKKIKITFSYANRDYMIPTYIAGSQILPYHLLKSIKIYDESAGGTLPTDQTTVSRLLKTYEFNYKKTGYLGTQDGIYTLLDSVKLSGSDGQYLNATSFAYHQSDNLPPSTTNPPHVSSYFFYNDSRYHLDVNGDGKDDLIDWAGNVVLNGPLHNPSQDTMYYIPYYGDPDRALAGAAADVNGDGKADFLSIRRYPTGFGGTYIEIYLYLAKKTGYDAESRMLIATDIPCNYCGVDDVRIEMGDFNGDGFTEFWVQFRNFDSRNPEEFIDHFIIGKSGLLLRHKEQNNNWEGLHTVTTVDISGSGKSKILFVKQWNGVSNAYTMEIGDHVLTKENIHLYDAYGNRLPETLLYSFYRSFTGDFNGDGKTDLLLYSDSAHVWNLFHSDGKRWVQYSNDPVRLPFINLNETIPNLQTFVADINSDGMDDLVQMNAYGSSMAVRAFYSTGCSFKGKTYTCSSTPPVGGTVVALNPGDYNGDGWLEFYCKMNNNGMLSHAYFDPFKPEKKPFLKSVVDGMGFTTKFEYTTLAEKYMYGYTEEPSTRGYSQQTNAPVLKSIATSNSYGGFNERTFRYRNGVTNHYYGGFLGFREISERNDATKIKTKTHHIFPELSPLLSKSETYYSPDCDDSQYEDGGSKGPFIGQPCEEFDLPIRDIYYDYTRMDFQNRVLFYPSRTTITDRLRPIRITVSDSCNQNGNITYRKTEHAWGVSSKIETVTQNRYVAKGNYGIPNKLEYTKTTTTYPGQPAFSSDTSYIYNNLGNLTSTISHPGKAKSVTTLYENFNLQGLPRQVTTRTAGLNDRFQTLEYDGRGRFATKITDMNGLSVQTGYDAYGNITETIDPRNNRTTHEYDGFERLKKTISPVDTTQTLWYWGRADGPPLAVYHSITSGSNKPPVTVYYDLLGRDIRSKSYNFSNQAVWVDKQYDSWGRVSRQSRPYFTGESQRWATYHYDNYGRLDSINDNGLVTTSRFNGLTTTVTRPDGTWRSKTVNALDQILSSTDNGGTLTYTYHSSGQPNSITAVGAATTMEYDDYGRQIQLNDPNAGATNYDYNAYGELTYQSDARGNVTQLTYLSDGRLDKKQTTEGKYQYTYYDSGPSYTLLKREQAPNYDYFEYIYDNLGRQTQVTQLEFEYYATYETSYDYDEHGNLAFVCYPGGFAVRNHYDAYGNLVHLSRTFCNDKGDYDIIWTRDRENALGQITGWMGGGLHTRTYDSYDLLTGITCDTLQNVSYQFKPENGNLLWRRDNTRTNSTENFSYDNLDRLTAVSSLKIPANLAVTYQNNGNIATKSDAGTYAYDAVKKHALKSITGPNDIPLATQTATYTSFSSVKTIKDYVAGTSIPVEAKFRYAPDNQRSLMQVYRNNVLQYTKFYGIKFEQVTLGPNPEDYTKRRNFYYINAPGGARMVYVSHGDNVRTGTLFYLLTDHQGSVTHVVDEWGNLAQEYSYDAWGRRRDKNTLQPYAQSFFQTASNLTPFFIDNFCTFDRGYTGHEHLDAFGMINMNGRLYDPVMARMLSPDNYVQDPENTQNYNRYSYCLNNPLKYIDPTGEYYNEANEKRAQELEKKLDKRISKLEKKLVKLEKKGKDIGDLKERITELKSSKSDIGDMRGCKDIEFRYEDARENNNQVIEPVTAQTGTNAQGHSIVTMYTLNESGNKFHENRHGGQIARKEYGFDSQGNLTSGYGLGSEVSAYRAQYAFNGQVAYYDAASGINRYTVSQGLMPSSSTISNINLITPNFVQTRIGEIIYKNNRIQGINPIYLNLK